ncbi:sigma 54-interacting transcriptional regulator [Burkholderia plantarii]|uniref:sigma 54-interacting transcriptional regulator n=1 Tax=Burkholderia plantarii TaxID=41899 RepID=UPI000ABD0C88
MSAPETIIAGRRAPGPASGLAPDGASAMTSGCRCRPRSQAMCSGGVCRRRPFSPPPDAASCRHHRRGPRWPYVAHGARCARPRAGAREPPRRLARAHRFPPSGVPAPPACSSGPRIPPVASGRGFPRRRVRSPHARRHLSRVFQRVHAGQQRVTILAGQHDVRAALAASARRRPASRQSGASRARHWKDCAAGGTREIDADMRIIAETNRDPEASIDSGTPRADLHLRISAYPVALPPL